MENQVRWGIAGCGKIAHKFADAIQRVPGNVLTAVASKTPGKAADFATAYGAVHVYDSYEALAQDPEVDAVYVSNIHMMHKETAMPALKQGKAVVIEKAMAINEKDARELERVAREHHAFIMEAMWSRFLPVTERVLELVHNGALGDIRMLRGNFSFFSRYDPASRIYDPALAGGALLDIGVYCLSYVAALCGTDPSVITGVAHKCPLGTDDVIAMLLSYPTGCIASLTNSVNTTIPGEMGIYGSKGYLEIPNFWDAQKAYLHLGNEVQEIHEPYENGFVYELMEVDACLAQGAKQSKKWPIENTIGVARIMDTLRNQWGIVYPGENKRD